MRRGPLLSEPGPAIKEPSMGLGSLGDANSLMQILPFVLIFVVFYFFLIRPQQQKQKQVKSMLEALRRGDRVVTAGGIIGTVAKVVNDDEVQLDIAEGVRVRVIRSTITSVLAKTEPASAKDDDDKEPEAADAATGDKGRKGAGARRVAGK
jgi:preprotein translocase subunit YajC